MWSFFSPNCVGGMQLRKTGKNRVIFDRLPVKSHKVGLEMFIKSELPAQGGPLCCPLLSHLTIWPRIWALKDRPGSISMIRRPSGVVWSGFLCRVFLWRFKSLMNRWTVVNPMSYLWITISWSCWNLHWTHQPLTFVKPQLHQVAPAMDGFRSEQIAVNIPKYSHYIQCHWRCPMAMMSIKVLSSNIYPFW